MCRVFVLRFLISIVMLGGLLACEATNATVPNAQKLRHELNVSLSVKGSLKEEDIIAIENTLRRHSLDGRNKKLFLDIWRNRPDPDINNWQNLQTSRIRSVVSEILSKMPHELSDEDKRAVYNFSKNSLNDEHPLVVARSLLTLGVVGKESDISLLEQLALTERPGISEPAIISLSRLCFSSGLASLKRVEAKVTSERLKRLVEKRISSWNEMLPLSTRTWCWHRE